MRDRLGWVAAVVVAAVGGAGCGTAANLVPYDSPRPARVYGGVRLDCETVGKRVDDYWPQVKQGRYVYGIQLALESIYFAVDLPLSAAGDTLTLPYHIWRRYHPAGGPAADDKAKPTDSTSAKP